MATRGSIPKVMAMAGIDMLPPEAGVPLIRRELTAGATRGEILIGQRLGVLMNEWDASGGVDTTTQPSSEKSVQISGPMLGKITACGLHNGFTIETTLDPATQPFLHDHQIDGTPVLPGVMGIEGFAEVALSELPGWHIEALEDVNFLAPFKFYRKEPRTLSFETLIHQQGDSLLADCRLIGSRTLSNQTAPQVTTHFTGRVRLSRQAPGAVRVPPLGTPAGAVVEADAIYRAYFHGPAYQVVERAWWDGNRIIGRMAKSLPTNHVPPELPTVAAPRLIELCFQTAGLWEMGVQGRMGLPRHIDQVRILRSPDQAQGPLFAVVTLVTGGGFDAQVLDSAGNCYIDLRGYRTASVPNAVDPKASQALQAAMTLEAVAA